MVVVSCGARFAGKIDAARRLLAKGGSVRLWTKRVLIFLADVGLIGILFLLASWGMK
jgi:hypothetical protein